MGEKMNRLLLIWICAGLFAGMVDAAEPIVVAEGLALRAGGGRGGRTAIVVDPVAALIAKGEFSAPRAGDKIALPNGQSATWRAIKVNKDGLFQEQGVSYIFCAVDLPQDQTMLLEAPGDTMAYVNGEPRGGDPYSYGYVRLPVALHKGANALLFAVGRGRLKVRLLPVHSSAMLDVADPTLPDILTGDREPLWAAVVVENTTDKPLVGLKLSARTEGASEPIVSDLPSIAPLTIRKVPFKIPVPSDPQGKTIAVSLQLRGPAGKADEASVNPRVCAPLDVHKRTFVSRIDDSVQYYAVNPAQKPSASNALILTLHGAAVEALGQAQAYKSKDWVTLVAPTNRRPYGFDWEEIGQLDALEVLEIAEKTIPHDPHRAVLAGHSMGGHGTWHIGLTFPDRFAAIGPSAGWSSFSSYASGRGGARGRAASQPSAMQSLLATANSPGDTLSLVHNSLSEDVYILHGEKDDNVPVGEARLMRNALSFHPNLLYHEEPGAGHWWGSKCVDWPPMFEMFEKARLPADSEVNQIEFTTADPAISGRFHWATIEQQIKSMRPSIIKLTRKGSDITGTTRNVGLLRFDVAPLGGFPRSVELDGQEIDLSGRMGGETSLVLANRAGKWSMAGDVSPAHKNASRGGPFVTAFNNHMIFAYGTHGSPQDAADAYDTARLVAENFYYRGNGSVDVIADEDFKASQSPDRNVVLFGNADTNSAWASLLGDCPIQVREGSTRIGDREIKGEDLAVLLLYPRPGSSTALVAAMASTGHAGAIDLQRLPVLTSGVGFPDWIVLGADSMTKGIPGVRAAGYFGNDWALADGETVEAN
jgi:hypothetical protein